MKEKSVWREGSCRWIMVVLAGYPHALSWQSGKGVFVI